MVKHDKTHMSSETLSTAILDDAVGSITVLQGLIFIETRETLKKHVQHFIKHCACWWPSTVRC